MHLVEDMDYEEGTSTITDSDAVPSVDAELNKYLTLAQQLQDLKKHSMKR